MFDGAVFTERLPDGRWRILKPVCYHGRTESWVIEAGFTTDMASVPRFLWWVYSPLDFQRAAILHDWLWACNRRGEGPDPVDSDGLFRRALREESAPPWIYWPSWFVVRSTAILEGRPGRWGKTGGAAFLASPFTVIGAIIQGVIHFP